MLSDLVLAKARLPNIEKQHQFIALQRRIAAAPKFELAPDFANAAEEIAVNFDVIANAIEHIRLPYREMWIEVAQQMRQRFSTAGIHMPEVQRTPHRIGFLVTAQSQDMRTFKAQQFWSFPDGYVSVSELAMYFDPTRVPSTQDLEYNDKLSTAYFKGQPSTYWQAASVAARMALSSFVRCDVADFDSVAANMGNVKALQFQFELGLADWSGECCYLLAVLGLLNTVNAVERSEVDQSRLNRARAKSGKAPLHNYYTLKISTRLKQRMKHADKGAGNFPHLRAHMVRGHWKVRKSGIYFWRSFMRGDPSKGTIEKTYEVTT